MSVNHLPTNFLIEGTLRYCGVAEGCRHTIMSSETPSPSDALLLTATSQSGSGSSSSSYSSLSGSSDDDDTLMSRRVSRVDSVDGAYERYLASRLASSGASEDGAVSTVGGASYASSVARRNRRLLPASPAKHLPSSPLDVVERQQLQRRLLEAGSRCQPLLETFHFDKAAMSKRIAAGPARGKLAHQLSVRHGLSLNSISGPLGSKATRIVTKLPPLLQQTRSTSTVVVIRSDEAVETVKLPKATIPRWMMEEMGMYEASHVSQHSHDGAHHSGPANTHATTSPSRSPPRRHHTPQTTDARDHAHHGSSVSFTGDTPLPPPSGGPIEFAVSVGRQHHHHQRRSHHSKADPQTAIDIAAAMEAHRGVMHAMPHIPLEYLPPPLVLPSDAGTNSAFVPPPHLRREALEKRLAKRAEEKESLLMNALSRTTNAVDASELSDPFASPKPEAALPGTTQDHEAVEATPKPEGIDDRTWGCTIRDPQGEAANRLRVRMEFQQPVPSNTPVCFGAADHLVQLCAPEEDRYGVGLEYFKDSLNSKKEGQPSDAFTASFAATLGARRKSMMNIPLPIVDVRDDVLLVLAVGVNTTAADETTLPYSDAELNAEWFARVMAQCGAQCALLRGYEATVEHIREAIGVLVWHARRAASAKRTAKILLYFSGKGRTSPSGDLLFCPHDSIAALQTPFDAINLSSFINLHELAARFIDLEQADTARSGMSPRRGAAPSGDGFRWNYPIVIYDTLIDRIKPRDQSDGAAKPPTSPRQSEPTSSPALLTGAQKKDFWRPKYYGGILALQHEGGTLSMTCSGRHHGLVVYYVCKASEGKLSGKSSHVGSISHITQFVAEKLRRRTIPTMELRCAPLPHDFVPRVAEEIFHPSRCLFATAAAKREAKRVRERKQCRWTMFLEISLEYRYNPSLYVSNLVRRIKELLFVKSRHVPKNAPPLMLWMGSRRMEHRFYLPQSLDPSADVLRFDLISCITRSSLPNQGRTGQYYVDASLESIEHSRFDYCKGEHCVVAHSQGVAHNRWSFNPFVAGLDVHDGAVGLRNHSDADIDFMYVLSECSVKVQEMEVLTFLDGKHCSELFTVHGSGSVNDLRRILKFARFGQLDIDFCRNTRVLKVEVTSLGENEVEEAAAMAIQKFVRRHLLSRMMQSRLTAARMFYKNHFQAWVDTLDAFQEDVSRWYVDFLEGMFTALESAQNRIRYETRVQEHDVRCVLHEIRCDEWIVLERTCRFRLTMDALKEHWLLRRLGDILPEYGAVSGLTQRLSAEEQLTRKEKMQRQTEVCAEFVEWRHIRNLHQTEWTTLLNASAPVRLGKRVKKPKRKYDVPLDVLMRF